jgi:molybdopterin molybdotransferase
MMRSQVRPLIRRLLGEPDPTGRSVVLARLAEPVSKAPGRRVFLRVRVEPEGSPGDGYRASLAGGQGSHVLSALASANGLAVIPEDVTSLPAGSPVEVIRLDTEVA